MAAPQATSPRTRSKHGGGALQPFTKMAALPSAPLSKMAALFLLPAPFASFPPAAKMAARSSPPSRVSAASGPRDGGGGGAAGGGGSAAAADGGGSAGPGALGRAPQGGVPSAHTGAAVPVSLRFPEVPFLASPFPAFSFFSLPFPLFFPLSPFFPHFFLPFSYAIPFSSLHFPICFPAPIFPVFYPSFSNLPIFCPHFSFSFTFRFSPTFPPFNLSPPVTPCSTWNTTRPLTMTGSASSPTRKARGA